MKTDGILKVKVLGQVHNIKKDYDTSFYTVKVSLERHLVNKSIDQSYH